MRNWSYLIPFFAALATSSCAIHPVPEDVTGVNTDVIVRQIRCETREAARNLILAELSHHVAEHPDKDIGKISQLWLDRLSGEEKREDIARFDYKKDFAPYPKTKAYFDLIYDTGVAYAFDLTMKESNHLSGGLGLLGPWSPSLALGIAGKYDRDRENSRKFTVTDTVGMLLNELSHPFRNGRFYCSNRLAEANYSYPIAGKIGIDKILTDFIRSAVFENLDILKKEPGPWVEDLTFTTDLGADVEAGKILTFAKAGSGLQVSDAALTPSVSRTDTHKVTIGMSLGAGAAERYLNTVRGLVFRPVGGAKVAAARPARPAPRGSGPVGNAVLAYPQNSSEGGALDAVDQVKSRQLTFTPAQ